MERGAVSDVGIVCTIFLQVSNALNSLSGLLVIRWGVQPREGTGYATLLEGTCSLDGTFLYCSWHFMGKALMSSAFITSAW